MKKWLLSHKWQWIGALIGAIIGFGYYKTIGCSTGTCAITGNPLTATLYFATMGVLVVSFRKPSSQKK